MHSTPIAHCACSFSPAYGTISHPTVAPAAGRPPSARHVTHKNTITFHNLRITPRNSRIRSSCSTSFDELDDFSLGTLSKFCFAVSFHRQYLEAGTRFPLSRSSSHHNQLPTPAPSHSHIPPFYIPRYLPSSRLAFTTSKTFKPSTSEALTLSDTTFYDLHDDLRVDTQRVPPGHLVSTVVVRSRSQHLRSYRSVSGSIGRFTTPSALLPPPSSLPPLASEPITIRTPPSLIPESLRNCACALRAHLVRRARRSIAGYDFEIRLSHEGPGSMLSSPRTRFMSPHPKRPMTPRSELLETRHCDGVKLLRVILFEGYLCREISF